jgi:4-methylaminobutanoate oxidase (formaldehyde-forming)
VGYVRSGSYGYTLGGAVGLFMIETEEPIDQAYIDAGKWEIDIAGKMYPAIVSLSPLYDPGMEKIKS